MKRSAELRNIKVIGKKGAAWLLTMALFAGTLTGIPAKRVQAATLSNPRRSMTKEKDTLVDTSHDSLSRMRTVDSTVTYDCVYFGYYWQEDTNNDGKVDRNDKQDKIKWRVLSVDGNDAFLIADKNLDMQRYNTLEDSAVWETCTMRSWLNGYGKYSNEDLDDIEYIAMREGGARKPIEVKLSRGDNKYQVGNNRYICTRCRGNYDHEHCPICNKRVPEKQVDEHKHYRCPGCDHVVNKEDGKYMTYCGECGQAIDWSEDRNEICAKRSFIANAFTDSERNAIKSTALENGDNRLYGTEGGNDTTDKVFLLSLKDISNTSYGFSNFYEDGKGLQLEGWTGPQLEDGNGRPFSDSFLIKNNMVYYNVYDGAKLRYNTDFAKESDTAFVESLTKSSPRSFRMSSSVGTGYWWLRSPGSDVGNAVCVFRNGYVYQHNNNIQSYYIIGVCPSLHLDLSHSDVWSYAGEETIETKETMIYSGKKADSLGIKDESGNIASKKMNLTLAAGKKITLTPVFTPSNCSIKGLKWKSSNTEYATVSDKGVVTTKKGEAGKTVTITAAAVDGSNKKAVCEIKLVKDAVKNVKLTAKAKSVKAGSKISVKAIVKTTGRTANKKLLWTSSNKSYATVTKKGVVKTKKAGKGKTVKITAKATDGTGKKATIKIKIR